MPRLFAAIELPDPIKDQILSLRQDDLPPGRWTRREALHLTLHFIGDVPQAAAEACRRALASVEQAPFSLQIAGVGQFPIQARPRVIWAGVDNSPALRALHAACGKALARADCNYEPEGRRYHPHITLMRFKDPLRRGRASRWLNAHLDFAAEPFQVERFVLFKSELKPGGAVYTALARYPLR